MNKYQVFYTISGKKNYIPFGEKDSSKYDYSTAREIVSFVKMLHPNYKFKIIKSATGI